METYRFIIVLLALIPALINISVFIYVFYFLPRNRINLAFIFLVVSSTIWQFSDAFIRLADTSETALLIYRNLSFGVLFLLPSSVHFSLLYTNRFNKKKSPIILSIIYIPSIILYLCNIFNIPSGYINPSELFCYTYLPIGIIDTIMSLWLGVLGLFTIYILRPLHGHLS